LKRIHAKYLIVKCPESVVRQQSQAAEPGCTISKHPTVSAKNCIQRFHSTANSAREYKCQPLAIRGTVARFITAEWRQRLRLRRRLELAGEYAFDGVDFLLGRRKELIPPRHLNFVGHGNFEATGDEFLRYFIDFGDLKPEHQVLEIGCGVGRMARPRRSARDRCFTSAVNMCENTDVKNAKSKTFGSKGNSYSLECMRPCGL
jgi:hypothetical protein